MAYDLNHKGCGFDKVAVVLEAAMRLAAAETFIEDHERRAAWAFDAAEAVWDEFCRRFEDDAEEQT